MKPPYLKKLTKKQLRKAYSDQWKQNIKVVTENYNLNRDNERLQTIVYNQEQEINTKAILLTEHFGKIQNLEAEIKKLRHEGSHDDIAQALSLSIESMVFKNIFKDPKDIEIQNLKQLLDHEQRKRTQAEVYHVDLEEALSRSRQLRKSLQEVADRKHGEKATIEAMAQNLHQFAYDHESWAFDLLKKGHYINNPTLKMGPIPRWENLSDDRKDHFRVQATHIISHLPTDDKQEGKPLDEGSAG